MCVRMIALVWGLALLLSAQQSVSADDPKKMLLAVREKVMRTVKRLPRYLCTETVDRATFQPMVVFSGSSCSTLSSRRKEADWGVREDTSDRLRLDVAVTGESEMFSWAGENRFRDRSLAALVHGGATETGAFGSFLSSIFGSDAATFTYNGDITSDGHVLAEFGFRVPREKSKFLVENEVGHDIVGYDGTFLANPETFDLVRLTIHADGILEKFRTCESSTVLHYGKIRLNESEFLIPTEARWHVIEDDGSEINNRTVFSACHEFVGESTLRFDGGSTESGNAPERPGSPAFPLPGGLPFSLALARPINAGIAAAGDPFQATFTRPIQGKNNRIFVTAGTTVTGRILRIERLFGLISESLVVILKLETVDANGVPEPFPSDLHAASKRHKKSLHKPVAPEPLGSFGQLPDRDDPGAGVFRFKNVTANYVIPRGFVMNGTTAKRSPTTLK